MVHRNKTFLPSVGWLAGFYKQLLLASALIVAFVPKSYSSGCTGANFSYVVNSIDYCTGQVCITFSGYATGLHGNESFCWNWGDGTPQQCDVPGLVGNQSYTQSGCHNYNLGSNYTVSLNVTPTHSTCLVSRDLVFGNSDFTADVSCNGDNDGCIYFTPNPFSPSMQFNWSNGATTQDVCGLSPGTYSLTVSDGGGCTITESFTVSNPAPINLTVNSSNCATGDADISVSGGTPPTTTPTPWSVNFDNLPDGTKSSGANQLWTSDNSQGGTWDQWEVVGGEWKGYSLDQEATFTSGCIDTKYCTNNTFSIDLARGCKDENNNDYFRVYYSCNGGPETQILNPALNDLPDHPKMCSFTAPIPNCASCLKIIIRTRRPHTGGTCNSGTVTSGPCATGSSSSTTTTTTTTTTGGGGNDQESNRHEIWMDNLKVGCTPTNPPPYTYLWCNGETTQDAGNIPTGISQCCVTVTDGKGCTATDCIQCCVLDVTTSATDVSCNGGSDGSGTVTIVQGVSPITYIWSNGQTVNPATGLTAGTYTVTVTGSDGCERIETITVNEPPPLTISLTPTHLLCAGDGNGAVNVSVGGGTPGYTYNWNNGQTGTTATGLAGGNYSVTATDANGCTITGSSTVNEPPPLTISSSPDIAVCPDDDPTSVISVTAGGGTPTYTYLWNPGGGTTASITVTNVINTTVTYNVTVTDANGCTITENVQVISTCNPVVLIQDTVVCAGGTVTVTPDASGGQPPYTYTWDNGWTGAGPHTFNPTTTTTVCVTVTDQNGASSSDCMTATINNPPTLTTTSIPTDCGQCNGGVGVSATGSGPYTYLWDNGCTSANCTALCPGTYNVTVTDANGCTSVVSENVSNSGAPQITTTGSAVPCFGDCSGTASVTVNVDGVPPYTFQWNNNQTSTTISGLCAGSYTVTITDATGCQAISSTSVTEPPPLSQTTSTTNNLCNGDQNGTAAITVNGGTPTYTYSWNPGGGTTASISGLAVGTYNVTATDANGCTITASVTITEPTPLVLTPSATTTTCGSSDGTVNVTASGATPAYTYLWAPGGATTANVTGLAPGTYNVTVTDANGCTATSSATVGGNGIPTIAITGTTDPLCNGDCTGTATAQGSGGTGPYTYMWSDPSGHTTVTATGLCAGTYDVCLTDQAGCVVCTQAVINEPPPLGVVVLATDEICHDGSGTTSVTAGGGTGPYSYIWDDASGATVTSLTNLSEGTYNVTVTDANGCTSTGSATVNNIMIMPTADFLANPYEATVLNPVIDFFDKSNGAISWQWDFGDGNTSIAQNPIHTYQDTGCFPVTLMIENQYGCRDTIPQTICVRDISSIYIPNAFTPNKDGKNEWFTVGEYNYCEIEMYIFDRWGNLIYETTNLKGWDGTANGGSEIVQEDVYVWLVKAVDCYGKVWRRIGHVTVIR